ncbi:hypothetical protein [Aeromonas caviae]|jgi:hypothetical protein|uniref:hypothetical protein n=1 Tax=Aeromonas caviae TaxID=648 RepID=UPI00385FB5F6
MSKERVRDTGGALAYLTDCTLATVGDLASKKSAAKGELTRQISMAQTAIDWMDRFGVDYTGTRAVAVKKLGSVAAWADTFRPQPK